MLAAAGDLGTEGGNLDAHEASGCLLQSHPEADSSAVLNPRGNGLQEICSLLVSAVRRRCQLVRSVGTLRVTTSSQITLMMPVPLTCWIG
jgi:hypothetical protein